MKLHRAQLDHHGPRSIEELQLDQVYVAHGAGAPPALPYQLCGITDRGHRYKLRISGELIDELIALRERTRPRPQP
jgi:hypothetical protein